MVGFGALRKELEALGAQVVAASVDPIEKATEVANEVYFPVGYGVTRDIADALGSWWEDRRGIIQPSEFMIGPDNKVMISSYSDGPLGRIEGVDIVRLIQFYEARAKK